VKFPEIEVISGLYFRNEISEGRMFQLLDDHEARRDVNPKPSRHQTMVGLQKPGILWREP
jgi:hypothetical protein